MVNSGDKKMPNGILEEQGTAGFVFLLSVNFVRTRLFANEECSYSVMFAFCL